MHTAYSVIVPVHNEQDTLEPLTEAISKAFSSLDGQFEIIYVDDGSTDRSAKVLGRLADSHESVKVIYLCRNFGQTAAMMAGIDYASGDILIPMDADMQNDPADIPALVQKIHEGADVCSGWRVNRQDNSLKRVLPSKAANWLISKISGVHLHDYGCSLKAYRAEVLRGVRLYGEMHRFIPIYASWQGAVIEECPVNHFPRTHGESKYGLERIFKVLLDLMVVKFLSGYSQKPIYIFGGLGLGCFVLSLLMFCWMLFLKFVNGTSFIQTPLPHLATMFLLGGLQSILLGLVAELLTRTYFESQGKRSYTVRETRNLSPSVECGAPREE